MPGRLANVAGAVLVGGSSERMGREKAGIEVDGVALSVRTARLLARLCEDVLIVGGQPAPGSPGRGVPDPAGEGPRCALRGLVGALEAAAAERVLVLATDMPALRLEVLLALVAWPEDDAVVVRDDAGRAHPLCAIYRREVVLAAARERLSAGQYALRGVLDRVGTSWLEGVDLAAVDPDGRAIANANTPEELAAALRAD